MIKYNKVPKYTIVGINGVKLVEFDWESIIGKLDFGLNSVLL